MLISRSDLEFDFKGARFNLQSSDDRKLLGWIFNQFLYGEVTGIQCGYWLYRAPHLNAAAFLAKQAGEELSHVKRILRLLFLIRETPGPVHPAVRFLSTGMMGGCWGEHVVLEMALGEGLVLSAFYALAQTLDDPEIKKILESALVEEERHVEFGERESQVWLASNPSLKAMILGSALIQIFALRALKRFILKRFLSEGMKNHPVLSQFEKFYDHSIKMFEKRVELLNLSPVKLSEMSSFSKAYCILQLPFRKILMKLSFKQPLLTSTYLQDPVLKEISDRTN